MVYLMLQSRSQSPLITSSLLSRFFAAAENKKVKNKKKSLWVRSKNVVDEDAIQT